MQETQKYRLVTRSNLDGIVSAVLLKKMNMIEDVVFVHPKDMQDGVVFVNSNDIVTNLPYVKGVHIAFDYSLSGNSQDIVINQNHVFYTTANSASEVVYEYYKDEFVFTQKEKDLVQIVNKAKKANYTKEEMLNPQGWNLLNFIMDSRTGLGRFKNFRISNYSLMMDMIDYCEKYSIDEILELPDVKERVTLYHQYQDEFKAQLKRCSTLNENIVLIDLTQEDIIYPGNRFMVYALFPEANVSIHKMRGLNNQNTVFAIGKSIFNDTSNIDIACVVSKHNGGGHQNAGTCQVEHVRADEVLEKLMMDLKEKSLCAV